jgi:hypothetical protein
MRRVDARPAFLVAAALALSTGQAQASSGYPAEIQAQLKLSYTPNCTICHSNNDTDAGSLTGFGNAMVMFGLMGGNNLASVDGALAGLEGTNSPYISYLKEGLDPNNPNTGITYGCFDVTGQRPTAGPIGLLVLGLTFLFLFRPRPRGPEGG